VRVLILSSAEEDLRVGFEFYERQYPGVGVHFFECIFQDIDALENEGGIHRVEGGYHRKL